MNCRHYAARDVAPVYLHCECVYCPNDYNFTDELVGLHFILFKNTVAILPFRANLLIL